MRSCQPRYTIEELVAEMRPGDEPETFDDVNSPPVGRETLWATLLTAATWCGWTSPLRQVMNKLVTGLRLSSRRGSTMNGRIWR